VRVLDPAQQQYSGITALMKDKSLLPRDVAVFYGVVERTNWRTGTCDYTLSALASELGLDSKYVINSVSRLKKVKALLNQRDEASGRRFIVVNPTISWAGGEAGQANALRAWAAAWKKEHPDEVMESIEDYETQQRIEAHNRRVDAVGRWKERNAA